MSDDETPKPKAAATKTKAKLLGAELDQLLKADKQREAVAKGEKLPEEKFSLYQTLYEYKSDDPDDLQFGPGEILR